MGAQVRALPPSQASLPPTPRFSSTLAKQLNFSPCCIIYAGHTEAGLDPGRPQSSVNPKTFFKGDIRMILQIQRGIDFCIVMKFSGLL